MTAAVRFLLALMFAGLLASGTVAFGAERTPAKPLGKPATPPVVEPVLVPDVRGKAYVFAKGMLEDSGFAWRVEGSVHGYAANLVASQSPAPGTKLVDTGAPTVTLHLTAARGYAELGDPEDASPFPGTEVKQKRKPGDRR
jgi:PASTA domain-containing protein